MSDRMHVHRHNGCYGRARSILAQLRALEGAGAASIAKAGKWHLEQAAEHLRTAAHIIYTFRVEPDRTIRLIEHKERRGK